MVGVYLLIDPGDHQRRSAKKGSKMTTIPIEEAQSHLADIINELVPGQEVVLTRENKAIATINTKS